MANETQAKEKKPLFMYLCASKENRETEVKDRHAGGKIAEFSAVFREKMSDIMKVNLMFSLFMIPFIVLTVWALNYMLTLSEVGYNVAGSLGVGYPGGGNDLQLAMLARLGVYFFYFMLIIPCFTIMGLGLAGAMNVCRKMFYHEDYKILKTFGQGIKKYWWKMMLLTTVIGVLVFLVAVAMIEFYKAQLLGTLTGGWYAMIFFVFLAGVILLFPLMQIAPQIVTYDKLKLRQVIKNSWILSILNFVQTLVFLALLLVPILLDVYVTLLGMLIYMLMILLGFMFYIMANLQIANYSFDLYINPMYDAVGAGCIVEKAHKNSHGIKRAKINKGVEKVIVTKPAQEKKTEQPTKKTAPQKYVNPKKKKSNKK